MQNQLCVSSYSLRQHLGPIHVMMRGAYGTKTPFLWEQPQTMSLSDAIESSVRTRYIASVQRNCLDLSAAR